MADLVRHAIGVDLVDVALRFALGEPVPDELARPQFQQPLAIRFLTAEPGPLPTGRVTRIGSLEPVLAAEGVVQADTYLQVGETIRPVRLDGDRRGYVIAIADNNVTAPRPGRGGGATARRRGGGERELLLRPRALPRDRRGRAGGRLPVRALRGQPRATAPSSSATTSTSRSTPRSGWPSSSTTPARSATYFLMTESVFYNLASSEGVAAIARLRELGHRVGLHAVYPNAAARRPLRPGRRLAQPRPRVHARAAPRRPDQRDAGAVVRPGHLPLRLEPALALGLPARRPASRRVPVAAAAHPPRDLGVSRARRWARRCGRCWRPRGSGGSEQLADDRIDLGVRPQPSPASCGTLRRACR